MYNDAWVSILSAGAFTSAHGIVYVRVCASHFDVNSVELDACEADTVKNENDVDACVIVGVGVWFSYLAVDVKPPYSRNLPTLVVLRTLFIYLFILLSMMLTIITSLAVWKELKVFAHRVHAMVAEVQAKICLVVAHHSGDVIKRGFYNYNFATVGTSLRVHRELLLWHGPPRSSCDFCHKVRNVVVVSDGKKLIEPAVETVVQLTRCPCMRTRLLVAACNLSICVAATHIVQEVTREPVLSRIEKRRPHRRGNMVEVDVGDHSVEWISQGRGEEQRATLSSECGFPTQQTGVVNVSKPRGTVMETHTLPLPRLNFSMHERIEPFFVLFSPVLGRKHLGRFHGFRHVHARLLIELPHVMRRHFRHPAMNGASSALVDVEKHNNATVVAGFLILETVAIKHTRLKSLELRRTMNCDAQHQHCERICHGYSCEESSGKPC